MAHVSRILISGYRSIKDELEIVLKKNHPLVIVGENNAGKSNIVKSLELILGETWPGAKEPLDHDFWNRSRESNPIAISIEFEDFKSKVRLSGRLQEVSIGAFRWEYRNDGDAPRSDFHGISSNGDWIPISNDTRSQCIAVVVGADRRVSYQLSYSTKWTLLSRLMQKFHYHLTSDEERVKLLKQKFLDLKTIFEEVAEFSEFQGALRNQFAEMFTSMSYALQIDFSAYDPSNFFHSLKVLPEEDGQIRNSDELGTGQEQMLALAFAHAYAKAFFGGIVLIIEEPEAHLHPLAQQWLAKRVRQMAADGLQIIITTHSPSFIDILGMETTVLVRKIDGKTHAIQRTASELSEFCINAGANPQKTRPENILPFYAASSTNEILSGLFAKKVILVEGPTESLALPIYLNRIGFDTLKNGIAVIGVGGKGSLARWLRFFSAYKIPTFVILDNDGRQDDQRGTKRKDALSALGIDPLEFDRILAEEDFELGNSFCVFGKDIETSMRNFFPTYTEIEDQAREILGNQKPLVARYVAQNIRDGEGTGWDFLRELAKRLEAL